ncbi:MAG TPA: hypothetical protein VNI57_04975 [Candidatus Saccharimonadales bacterium]|nr:hypothetical protein [Candidatus Saccharimonadales bacterium]
MADKVKPALAVVLVGALAWLLYTQFSGVSLLPGATLPALPAEPDPGPLKDLKDLSSFSAVPLLGGTPSYSLGGRNLFQYGQVKPPPPSPEELEARRKAEEARLKALEEAARQRQAALDAAKKAAEDARKNRQQNPIEEKSAPPAPQATPKPPPPPMNFKLVGYLGPQTSRIAVFYTDKDKEILLGRKGEVIEGKFRVVDIGAESVEMGYVDPEHAGTTKTIQLGK